MESMDQQSDESLVTLAQRGDRRALDQLVGRYLPRFLGTARGMLGVPEEAEEVAQDSMLKVLRSLPLFRSRSSFRAWSYAILVNTLRTSAKRRVLREQRIDRETDVGTVSASPAPATSAEALEVGDVIHRAFRGLSDKLRVALFLTVVEGVPAADVAEIEGCSIDAVYQRVSEARKQLRRDSALMRIWFGE